MKRIITDVSFSNIKLYEFIVLIISHQFWWQKLVALLF